MVFTLPELERVLSYAGPVAAGILLLNLWRHGLLSRYRYFSFYLFLLLSEVVVVLSMRRDTSRYFEVYAAYESVVWVAHILIVRELFSLVVDRYPGIARSARAFIWVAFGAAILVSTAFAVFHPGSGAGPYVVIQKYMLVSRVVAFTVLGFLFLLLGFLLYFPVSLSRNVVSYAIGYSVYFSSRALTRLLGNLVDQENLRILSVVSLTVVSACLIFWIVFLNRRGEEVDMTVGHRWSDEQAKSLAGHLNSINTVLLKAGRK